MKIITGALWISAFKRELRSLTGLTSVPAEAVGAAANLFKIPLACLTTALLNSAALAPSICSTTLPPLIIIKVGTAEISNPSEMSGYSSASIY
jgi:hypothetical protein